MRSLEFDLGLGWVGYGKAMHSLVGIMSASLSANFIAPTVQYWYNFALKIDGKRKLKYCLHDYKMIGPFFREVSPRAPMLIISTICDTTSCYTV
jgi:hypothetical protein